ncbi:glycosyltransferase family 2 protein [Planktotalea sp.]|uniref:glycosyltransferase family 2 protein n=1 Tax=Planktotalea sp. TaxID=2029877 RepID=UPI00329A4FD1
MSILGITCLRNDGAYAPEWIAHHLAAGFDRMLVLSHDNTDGTDAVLEALSQDPRISYVPFAPKGKKSVQWQALKLAQDHPWLAEAEWAMFFDCDEFLCLPEGGSVRDLIAAFEAEQGAFDALALPWRLYGSAGQDRREAGLTPERFTKAAPMDVHFPLAHLFKTLNRPTAFRALGVHRPRAKKSKPARWVGPDGSVLSPQFAAQDGAISIYGVDQGARRAWLNHYSLRSSEEFLVKRARGLPNHMEREIGLTYWAERNWNSEDAPEILPMLDATRAELESMPDVADLVSNCLNVQAQVYREAVDDIDVLRLQFRLGLLGSSVPPSAAEGRAFLRAQIKILQRDRV